MSKLAKAIEASWTGDRVAARELKLNYTDIEKRIADDPSGIYRAYDIRAVFSARKVIDNQELYTIKHQDTISNETLKDIKRAIIEEVFGEFRHLLIEMRAATYDQDNHRMRNLLAVLEQQMFHDGM